MSYLDDLDLTNQEIGQYHIEKKLGEGAYGITYKALNKKIGNYVAIKFLRPLFSMERWMDEAKKAALVINCPYIIRPIDFDEIDYENNNRIYKLKYIVWEYINDNSIVLRDYLISNPNIPVNFIIELCRQLLIGIKAIYDGGIKHGDLHEGNILLIPPPSWDNSGQHLVKIVDFGLASLNNSDYDSDIISLSKIIHHLWEISKEYEGTRIWYDKKFIKEMPILIAQMSDTNPERCIKDPIIILKKIEEMKEKSKLPENIKQRTLEDPFSYLSAEEIPEESDLLSYLFSDSLPWYQDIRTFGTMIISGLRGSGKSMLLKNMRLKTKIMSEKGKKDIIKDSYVGFYIQCTRNFYVPFAGKHIYYEKINSDMILHLFNLLVTNEIVDSLLLLKDELEYSFNRFSNKILHEFVSDYFKNKSIQISSVDIIEHLKTELEREVRLVQRYIIQDRYMKKLTGVNYLGKLVQLLKVNYKVFKNKNFYFLLDDYSDARGVNEDIQKSINRIIGFRNDDFCFKITAERYAFHPLDIDENYFDQDREFKYLDLSQRFLNYSNIKDEELFIESIINKRFKRSGVNRDVRKLFGSYKYPMGTIGRSLGNPDTRKNTKYAGFNTICRLCSGDIATLLELFREIYRYAESSNKLPKDKNKSIDFNLQDQIIKTFSRNRLAMIRDIQEYGEKLYEIAYAMGEISRNYLYEYGEIGNQKLLRYQEIIRIEVEGIRTLSDKIYPIYRALIKYGIFSDAGTGYPWGKKINNIRLVFRKIYTPTFQISYLNSESIRITPGRFEVFLNKPSVFAKSATKFLDMVSQPTLLDIDRFDESGENVK